LCVVVVVVFKGAEARKEFAQFAEKMRADIASVSSDSSPDDDGMEITEAQKPKAQVAAAASKPKRPAAKEEEDEGRAATVGKAKRAFPIVKKK